MKPNSTYVQVHGEGFTAHLALGGVTHQILGPRTQRLQLQHRMGAARLLRERVELAGERLGLRPAAQPAMARQLRQVDGLLFSNRRKGKAP